MLPITSRTGADSARATAPYPRSRVAATLWPAMALLIVALWSSGLSAFDMNSDAPISVNADHARLDDMAGRATYTGNVVIVQAETSLRADRVELYRDAEGLSRILAFGDPAVYEQAETSESPETDARADEIEFDAASHLLTFRENAVIRQAGDIFRGDLVRYQTENRVVTAERGSADDSAQVEMIIQPRRQQNSDSNPATEDGNGPADRN